jgi:hypothetical protein
VPRDPKTEERLVPTWTIWAWLVISAAWLVVYFLTGNALNLVLVALGLLTGVINARRWHRQRERRAAVRADR